MQTPQKTGERKLLREEAKRHLFPRKPLMAPSPSPFFPKASHSDKKEGRKVKVGVLLFMHSFTLTFTYQLNDIPNTNPFEEKQKCSNTGVGETRTNKSPRILDGGTTFSFLSLTDAKEIKLSTTHH